MLLQFHVENFRSFQDEVSLNLIPGSLTGLHADHILRSEESGKKVQALPLALLYGANASGKSNLIAAMALARECIVTGTIDEEPLGMRPFRLDPVFATAPTKFEFIFKTGGVLYTYGFSADARAIHDEWLFAVVQKQEVLLFERTQVDGSSRFRFGKLVSPDKAARQRLTFIGEGTRPNQLFLREARARNVEALAPVFLWFRDQLQIISPHAQYRKLVIRAHLGTRFLEFLSRLLRISDTGIDGVEVVQEKFDVARHLPGAPEELVNAALRELATSPAKGIVLSINGIITAGLVQKNDTVYFLALRMRHLDNQGRAILFDPLDESDGTHRLLHLAPLLLDLQTNDNVYVIDELERSLHPLLSSLFLRTFLDGIRQGINRGQLIVTTHDTGLMDLGLLRRDEVWFMEKDAAGVSRLTPMDQYRDIRADLRVEKAYLTGRFGAIPAFQEPAALYRSDEPCPKV